MGAAMSWTGFALFGNIDEFNAWHESVKAALGFPLQGVNAETGEPAPGVFATEYTEPVTHPQDGRVICTYSPAAQYTGDTITPQEAIDQGWFPSPPPPGTTGPEPTPEPEPEEVVIDYNTWLKAELKEAALAVGITILSADTKAVIIEKLEAYPDQAEILTHLP